MSTLSKQVKELREMSIRQRNNAKVSGKVFFEIENALSEAADTIEALSAKLQAANMENGGGWIACEDRLPKDMEDVLVFYKANIDGGTHDGEEIYNFGIGYYFSHNKKWSVVTLIKPKGNTLKITAWQPLPEPYRP